MKVKRTWFKSISRTKTAEQNTAEQKQQNKNRITKTEEQKQQKQGHSVSY